MWSRSDVAAILVAATIFLTIGLLLFPAPAQPASPPPFTGREATAYMRGWVDGASPPGYYVTSAACVAAKPRGYWCAAIVEKRGAARVCAKALITGYAFPGPMQYGRCKAGSSAPPS